MIIIDPAWQGKVEFYELVYGTWLAYIFLVLMFEKALRQPLQEWRYVMINFVGAGAFWINHYFQFSGSWLLLINLYTLGFLAVWCLLAVRGHGRSVLWKAGSCLGAVMYIVGFIGFENIARYGVDRLGYSEFWFMLTAYLGFVGVILWRSNRSR